MSSQSYFYAKALFECDSRPEIFSQLKHLCEIFNQTQNKAFFMSYTVSKEQKKQVLKQALKTSLPTLKNFFYLLLDQQNLSLLPQILKAYKQEMDEKTQTLSGQVSSPFPLPEDKKQALKSSLEKFFHKKIELQYKEDKTLITGFSVNIGEYVFNNTARQQLKGFESQTNP